MDCMCSNPQDADPNVMDDVRGALQLFLIGTVIATFVMGIRRDAEIRNDRIERSMINQRLETQKRMIDEIRANQVIQGGKK